MGRPTSGRRLHVQAFDAFVAIRGLTNRKVAEQICVSEGHISDMRSGRRLVAPPIAAALADALNLESADCFLWPAAAVAVAS